MLKATIGGHIYCMESGGLVQMYVPIQRGNGLIVGREKNIRERSVGGTISLRRLAHSIGNDQYRPFLPVGIARDRDTSGG